MCTPSISYIGKPFLFLLLLINYNLYGQSPGLNFRYLNSKNGLSSDDVRCIYQDNDGFMWFGTEGGADRYDGKEFKNYIEFIKDTIDNLPQRIMGILEDHDQHMWFINDTNGIVVLNKKTGTVNRYANDPGDPKSLSSNDVRSLFADSKGNVWITTFGGGLNRFNKKDSTFTRFVHDSNDSRSIASNYLSCIKEDHNGKLWISSTDGYLIKMDTPADQFENIRVMEGTRYIWTNIITPDLYIDAQNNIWYAHLQSLYKYNPVQKKVSRLPLDFSGQNQLLYLFITAITETEPSVFLITTANNGYYLYDVRQNKISHYTHNTTNPFGINSNRLSGVFRSNEGVIWIASSDNGINIYSRNSLRFPELAYMVDIGSMANAAKPAYCFLELPDSRILIGTENNGLLIYDPSKKTVGNFLPELSNFSVYDLFMDKNLTIWICTWINGFYKYDWQRKRLTRVTGAPDNSKNIMEGDFVRYYTDRKGRIWMGTMTRGARMFDRASGKMLTFLNNPADQHSLSSNLVFKIFEDSGGKIWIGTTNGLNVFNDQKGNFDRIILNTGQTNQQLLVIDIFEDGEGNFWIGSSRGLHWYDRKTGHNKLFSNQYKGNATAVNRIFEDDQANLWMGTSNGIYLFNKRTEEITDFGKTDGIYYLAVNPNSGLKSKNGFIYFGSSRGVTVFNPSSIVNDSFVPPVVITSVSVNDIAYSVNRNIRNVNLQPAIYSDSIHLNYKQTTLEIKFAALNYNNPQTNEYAYQLTGYDKDWVKCGNSGRAYYPNLPPGKYIFKVIASNSHGRWNTIGAQLFIRIKPPIWRTWWFEAMSVLVFVALMLLIYFSRINGLKRKKILLEGIVSDRTKALNDANISLQEQHEELLQQHEEISSQNELLSQMSSEILQQNAELEKHRSNLEKLVEERTKALEIALKKAEESDRLKSAFLANMSHEIRTPMNAIVGFTNLLRDSDITQEEKDEFVEVINANSEILLVLIDDILDLSLIEANQLTIRKESVNMNETLDHLYSSFSLMNKKEGLEIRLRNELHDQHIQIESDRVRIKQILSNLMNNAYKFTEKGYVELGVKKKDDQLVFYVKDTGIGIDRKDIGKVFERFRKSDANNNVFYRGTGLGLAISKALAEMLEGDITIESNLGVGSVFSFHLPWHLVSSVSGSADAAQPQHEINDVSDKNILLVEDEQANFLYTSKLLYKMNINVHWAQNGAEAIKMISSGVRFDLVLMDIKMPVMDGFEATKRIKAENPSQTVIALTAYARPEDRNHFMKAGFDDYLAKPIKPNDFMGVIRRYL